jgi:hypothetical protein
MVLIFSPMLKPARDAFFLFSAERLRIAIYPCLYESHVKRTFRVVFAPAVFHHLSESRYMAFIIRAAPGHDSFRKMKALYDIHQCNIHSFTPSFVQRGP